MEQPRSEYIEPTDEQLIPKALVWLNTNIQYRDSVKENKQRCEVYQQTYIRTISRIKKFLDKENPSRNHNLRFFHNLLVGPNKTLLHKDLFSVFFKLFSDFYQFSDKKLVFP